MMNIEKYYKEILKNKDSFAVNEQTGKVSRCSKIIYKNCKFYYANSCYEYDNCEEAKLSWLFEENEESNSILTEEERKYLKSVLAPFETSGGRIVKRGEEIDPIISIDRDGQRYPYFSILIFHLINIKFKFDGLDFNHVYSFEELGL